MLNFPYIFVTSYIKTVNPTILTMPATWKPIYSATVTITFVLYFLSMCISWVYYYLYSPSKTSLAANVVNTVHLVLILAWLACHCHRRGNENEEEEEELDYFVTEETPEDQNKDTKILFFPLVLGITILIGAVLLSIDVANVNKTDTGNRTGFIIGIVSICVIGLTSFGLFCCIVAYFVDKSTTTYIIGRYLDYKQKKRNQELRRLEELRSQLRASTQNQANVNSFRTKYYTFSS